MNASVPSAGFLPMQGWVVTDAEILAMMNIPDGETVVEIPDQMIQFFRQFFEEEARAAG